MPTEEIVGWAMEATLATILVEKAFLMAVANRRTVLGLLHHSDRGSQDAGAPYPTQLALHHIQVSMSHTHLIATCISGSLSSGWHVKRIQSKKAQHPAFSR